MVDRLAAIFVGEMGLGIVGIGARMAGGFRPLTGSRAENTGDKWRRWYCGNAERAGLVADHARASLRKLEAAASLEDAAACIMSSAQSLGVLLIDEKRIRERAEQVVADVEQQFESLVARGELKSVNAGYRQYRLATTLAGKKPIGYPTFISNYKAGLVRAVAQHSRLTLLEN